jgi:NADH-quinone oxidoreductase subunit C
VSEARGLIEAAVPGAVVDEHDERGQTVIEIDRAHLSDVMRFLQGPPLSYVLLCSLTCADFLETPEEHPERFRLAYQLLSLESGSEVRIRVWAGADDPVVASVVPIWSTANFMEREVYDMFGVRFEGHPDLCRIMMPLDWEGHPLRRDYPIGGEPVRFTDQI